MQQRWQLFADILHHHHAGEDAYYWPALSAAVQVRGTVDDQRLVAAMEDEHAGIDPALTACAAGIAEVLAHPCESHRAALEVRIVTFREALDEHLAHEEGDTLPLVQRVMTATEFAAAETAIERGAYPPRMIPVVLPWALHRLPAEARGSDAGLGGTRPLAAAPPAQGRVRAPRERGVSLQRRPAAELNAHHAPTVRCRTSHRTYADMSQARASSSARSAAAVAAGRLPSVASARAR